MPAAAVLIGWPSSNPAAEPASQHCICWGPAGRAARQAVFVCWTSSSRSSQPGSWALIGPTWGPACNMLNALPASCCLYYLARQQPQQPASSGIRGHRAWLLPAAALLAGQAAVSATSPPPPYAINRGTDRTASSSRRTAAAAAAMPGECTAAAGCPLWLWSLRQLTQQCCIMPPECCADSSGWHPWLIRGHCYGLQSSLCSRHSSSLAAQHTGLVVAAVVVQLQPLLLTCCIRGAQNPDQSCLCGTTVAC